MKNLTRNIAAAALSMTLASVGGHAFAEDSRKP